MPQKIPATVITGFLGAGKTTLIRNLLAQAGGRRIALIINEFGDIGVDGDVLKGCGDSACAEEDIVELSNGCICCTVADDFVPTMETLINRENPPEHIVIETSGLALPQPLVRAFNWPDIRTRVTVDGVVTVVDGPATASGQFAHDIAAIDAQRAADETLDHDTPLSELFEDQLACADMVVVSKTDVMDGADLDAVLAGLAKQARAGVQFVRSGSAGLSPDILLGLGFAAEADMANRREHHHHHHDDHENHENHESSGHHEHHLNQGDLHEDSHENHIANHENHGNHEDHQSDHDHDAFDSFAVSLGEIGDLDGFLASVQQTIRQHGILRLKGFVAITGKPMRLVIQAVGPRIDTYFDRPFGAENRTTRLVVIGLRGMDQPAIHTALAS